MNKLTKSKKCITYNTEAFEMAIMSLRLPDEVFERLTLLAKKTRRSKSSFIQEMIEESLADLEDGYIALERLNHKNARYLTTEEVEKKLGL
jgi:RHH-type transcriptional regulator, rel operon repressor / antitoxin RelB